MKTVKALFAMMIILSTAQAAEENPFAGPFPQRSRFGMNISGISFWSVNNPFADAIKTARPWQDTRIISRDDRAKYPLEVDGHGYPLLAEGQQASAAVLNDDYPAGRYVLTWQGKAELELETPGLEVVSRGPNRIELEGKPSGLGTIILKSGRISDMHLWLPGLENTDFLWRPEYLASLYCYGTLRYMDYMKTNRSPIEKWEDRPEVADFTYGEKGIPLEHLIDLANRLDADPWFCMPERCDDRYVAETAKMVAERLKPTLCPIVEYSNEVGNGSFAIYKYAAEMGEKLALASQEDVDKWNAANEAVSAEEGDNFIDRRRPMNVTTMNRHRFQALRTSQIAEIWRKAFTADPHRVKVVLTGNPTTVYVAMAYRDTMDHVDWISSCSYWGFGITRYLEPPLDDLTTDDIFDLMEKDLDTKIREKAHQMGLLARRLNKPLVIYEGGQHLSKYGGGYDRFDAAEINKMRAVCLQCQRHPRMGELMKKDFDIWFANGAVFYAVFSHISQASGDYAWGMQEYVGQPLNEAPKAKALLEYMSLPEIPRCK